MLITLACGVAGLSGALSALRFYLCRKFRHLATGDQRRSLWPAYKPVGLGAQKALTSDHVKIKREVCQISGRQYFFQVVTPTKCSPSQLVIFFHGWSSHSDMYLEFASRVACEGSIVVLLDLPMHGRSDGLLLYIPDWWAWVAEVWKVVDAVVPPVLAGAGRRLKTFAMGPSLGGGLVACMALQRPTFFDGIVLLAPMLYVSDNVKPPWPVVMVFKHVLARILPLWPLTPNKDLDMFDFRIPEQGYRFNGANPINMRGCKPRLGTAKSLGFTFPEWMDKHLHDLQTPYLLCHGDSDKITDPAMSRRLHDVAASSDKTLKIYAGVYHCEIFCCLPGHAEQTGITFSREQVDATEFCLRDIVQWLSARA